MQRPDPRADEAVANTSHAVACAKCTMARAEMNMINKLLHYEKIYSDHLKTTRDQLWARLATTGLTKQLLYLKSIDDKTETLVEKLRDCLSDWRRVNNRLDTSDQTLDQSISSDTDSVSRATVSSETDTRTRVSSAESQTATINAVATSRVVVKDEGTSQKDSKNEEPIHVELEVIPKQEALDPEPAEVMAEVASSPPRQPGTGFQFLSHYLYKKTRDDGNGRELSIDLNNDSDNDGKYYALSGSAPPQQTDVFDDDIVDLTPSPKKNIKKKKTKKQIYGIKRKRRPENGTTSKVPNGAVKKAKNNTVNNVKKPIVKTSKPNSRYQAKRPHPPDPSDSETGLKSTTTSLNIESPDSAHLRVIESNRKKIRINNDNTITILDITPKSAKTKTSTIKTLSTLKTPTKVIKSSFKRKPVTKSPIKKTVQKSPVKSVQIVKAVDDRIDPKDTVLSVRQKSLKYNETYIQSKLQNKQILFKGKLYHCQWSDCGYTTDTRANAIRHMWRHTGEAPFKCSLCGEGFRDKRGLHNHIMLHNAKQTAKAHCPGCEKSYAKFAALVAHMKSAHGQNMAVRWITDYEKHKSLLLGTNFKVTITESPKPTKKKSLGKVVAKSEPVVTENDNRWQCDFTNCTREYSLKMNLKRHQLQIHKKLSKPLFSGTLRDDVGIRYFIPKPQSPTKSPKQVPKATPKNQVIASSPVGEKAFLCNYKNCLKSFQSISGLYKHKKSCHMTQTAAKTKTTDKTDKPFVCTYCTASYHCKGTLAKHVSAEHKSEVESDKEEVQPEYPCPYGECEFVATTQKSQLIHWKKHFSDEDKPFKCLISGCNYSNKELASLKNHVWNKHSEQQFFRAMEETGIHYPIWY